MATRRIARGRGGSPVPIIILTVLLVGAIALAVVFGMKMNKLQEEMITLNDRVGAAQDRERATELKAQQFKTLVGLNYDAMQESFDKLKKDALEKSMIAGAEEGGPLQLETVADLVEAYAREVQALRAKVNDLDTSLAKAKAAQAQAELDARKVKEETAAEVQRITGERDKARDERDTIQKKLDGTTQTLQAKIGGLEGDKTKLIKDVNHWKKAYEIQKQKVADLLKQIDVLKHPVDIRGPLTGPQAAGEPVDGKVLTLAPDGDTCMIDLGRRDWVQIGMEFRVYDNADPESRTVKGHIQIRKVMDTIAQCKIMEQDKLDPILPGMVLVNPAFQRGKTLNFVLVEPFREPNVEQLLARYPCKVKKVNPTDTETLDRDTDYVITGEGHTGREGITRPEDSPTVDQAKKHQITIMKESTLLRYLGELD